MKTYGVDKDGKPITSLTYISNDMGEMWDVFQKEILRVFKNYKNTRVNRVTFHSDAITVTIFNNRYIRWSTIAKFERFNKKYHDKYYIDTKTVCQSEICKTGRYICNITICRINSFTYNLSLKEAKNETTRT